MKTHVVLVTGVGGNIGQGIVKALRASRHRFRIVGVDMEPLSAGFSLVDRYACVPRTGTPGFQEMLKVISREEGLEAIYVCSPTELEYFSRAREGLESELGASIFVNPPAVCAIGDDKWETARFLQRSGFPFPRTAFVSDEEALEKLMEECGFPLILKPRKGFTSVHVFTVSSRQEIQAARKLVPDLVAQEFLPDTQGEFTAGTVSGPDARVRACIVLRRHLLQGTTYRTELLEDPGVSDQIRRIAEALGAVGVCNLQFRLVKNQAVVFEVNPRFSGTSGVRYLYGFNDPEMMFELFCLHHEICQPELRKTVVLRYWNELVLQDADFQKLRAGQRSHDGKIAGGQLA